MYCDTQDIIDRIPDEVLIRLTDDEDTGEVNTQRIEQAISSATAEINAYAQKRYPVPFSPAPPILKKLAEDIAIYNLYARRGLDKDSSDAIVSDRYKAAIKFLEHLAEGKVAIGAPKPPPQPYIHFKGPRRVFSRDKLEGM